MIVDKRGFVIAICSGDYESALVLYHRAANLYPKDSNHGVAARRTAATISSCNNPSKAVRKVSPISGEQLTAALCPETAAIIASEKLKKSPEPATIPEVLRYVVPFSSFLFFLSPNFLFLHTIPNHD